MCFSKKLKTSYGCKIDNRKIPGLPEISVYEQALKILVDKFSQQLKLDITDVISRITIEWWNDLAPSPSTGEINTVVVYNGNVYSGLTIDNTCKVAWRGKLYRSAFTHEISHVIGCNLLNDCNSEHKNQILNDIVKIINEKLKEEDI